MNYSNRGTQKKQKQLRSTSTKLYSKTKVWLLRLSILGVIGIIVIGGYAGYGLINGVLKNTPTIDANHIEPEHFASTIYDNKGKEVYQLVGSNANRISVSLEQIPTQLQQAFIAIEDERFYNHEGIDVKGIARVTVSGIASGSFDQGASTITQQLLKNIVFSGGNESTFADKLQRKIQEQYLAIKLEKTVSKDEILKNYLNTINLGQNTLGVQAASLRYFDKDVSELTLSECAVIAGITKNPSYLNPISYPENNASRRNDVLNKMLELGMITNEEYDEALNDDVYSRIQKVNKKKTKLSNTVTSYFTDAVIDDVVKDLQDELGYTEEQANNLLYRGGLKIYTTQDQKLQKICNSVLSDSSLYPTNTQYELTFRLTTKDKDGKLHNYDELMLQKYFKKKEASFDLLFPNKKTAKSYVKKYKKHILKKSDTIERENVTLTLQPQISFVFMDQSTVKVKALVGGRGEKVANRTLNRATSSVRQPGSTFKVLSTYLPALDATNMTLASVQDDAEYYYPGTGKRVKNWYSSGYRGLCTLREGIKDSLNVVTVKTLADVTPKTGFSYLKKLGFTTLVGDTSLPANDVTLATSLGGLTYGVTNLETTAAYASIANQGVYRKPILYTKILDHEGNVLIDKTSKKKRVMKEGTAYLLTSAMKDVVNCGTGTLARFTTSSMPVAGKTGTTTDNVDAWFVGYTPYYTAEIWMGYDNNQSLVGTTYHKTIWRKIMEQVHKGYSVKDFKRPSSVVAASICTKSGKLARKGVCDHAAGGSTVRTEYFNSGSVPTKYCDAHIMVKVCKSSGKIANSYCPKENVTQKIFLKKNETCTTRDTPYVVSSKQAENKCKVHTEKSKKKKTSKKKTSTKKKSTNTKNKSSTKKKTSTKKKSTTTKKKK